MYKLLNIIFCLMLASPNVLLFILIDKGLRPWTIVFLLSVATPLKTSAHTHIWFILLLLRLMTLRIFCKDELFYWSGEPGMGTRRKSSKPRSSPPETKTRPKRDVKI